MSENLIVKINNLKRENPQYTWEQMGRLLGFSSGEGLRSEYRRRKAEENNKDIPEPLGDQRVIEFFHDKKTNPNWRNLIAMAQQRVEDLGNPADILKSTTIDIATDKPILIVYSGDWHLGDLGLDYESWLNDMKMIIDTPGVYLVDLGDSIQNMRSFKNLSSVLSQALAPKEQGILMRSLVNELTEKQKLLCKVEGNHDFEFDERIFGDALQRYLLENMNAPLFVNRGLIYLNVGSEMYSLYVFHKTRFRSIFRAAHGAWREWQFGYPADIVAGGHDHTPAFEMLPSYTLARESGASFGGLTFLIKVGTYQEDHYGWKYFHNGGRPEAISVVLWPDKHHMQAFLSLQDAVRFMKTFDGGTQ